MSVFSRLLSALRPPARKLDPIHASHDAARDTNETKNIWANSDGLDADSANSLGIRQKLRNRSRYERTNNGHCSGIIRTHANYCIGTGPKLRMQTSSPGFNAMVEAAWIRWTLATGFARKLRTMSRSKTGDGEAFAIITQNQAVNDVVNMDLQLIECDQVTAPVMTATADNYVDGVTFDEFGNPLSYDILNRHPGSSYYWTTGRNEFTRYDARFVCHWYSGDERPGQHRGIPELSSTLNLFATGRRYREAVVAAAETAADFSAAINMGAASEGNDEVAPFTTLPIEKRTMVVMPAGATLAQMKAEQPTTAYDTFTRSMVCEEARPINMPYNIAACDSSDYSYSGGQLDHQAYFVSLDIERQDCEQAVVDKVFALWFALAQDAYQWTVPPMPAPKHEWAWMGKPHSDPTKIADSRKTRLSCGDVAPSELAAEDGVDFEDRVTALANDYGVSVDEIKAKMFQANFQQSGGAPGTSDKPDLPLPTASAHRANGNGHSRLGALL